MNCSSPLTPSLIHPLTNQLLFNSLTHLFQVQVTLRLTVSQSVSQYVLVSSPILGSWPNIYYCLAFMVLFLWGALSDERTGLSSVHVAGSCQHSLSWVWVPWDLQPYFTVSDSRLPFSSPPTTCWVTVEVFDPASTRVCGILLHIPGTDHRENTVLL
jgi:hypothetical protein